MKIQKSYNIQYAQLSFTRCKYRFTKFIILLCYKLLSLCCADIPISIEKQQLKKKFRQLQCLIMTVLTSLIIIISTINRPQAMAACKMNPPSPNAGTHLARVKVSELSEPCPIFTIILLIMFTKSSSLISSFASSRIFAKENRVAIFRRPPVCLG